MPKVKTTGPNPRRRSAQPRRRQHLAFLELRGDRMSKSYGQVSKKLDAYAGRGRHDGGGKREHSLREGGVPPLSCPLRTPPHLPSQYVQPMGPCLVRSSPGAFAEMAAARRLPSLGDVSHPVQAYLNALAPSFRRRELPLWTGSPAA
jgi:hypothetical protein